MFGPLLDVQMSFRVAGARDSAPCQTWAKREGFLGFPKTMAGVGRLKRICTDAFSVAVAIQTTCPSEMLGGEGADFLRGVTFWSIKKIERYGALLDVQMSFRMACARECAPCQNLKVSKTWRFCSISKNDGRRGIEEDLQRCIYRGRRSTKDMFIRDVRRWGRWFPEEVAFWSIRSVGLLRWFCVTGEALCMTWHHFFVAGAILQRHGLEKSQNAYVRGRQLCIQLSIIEGTLTELLRFWCCQLRKFRKSRRIALFSNLQKDR